MLYLATGRNSSLTEVPDSPGAPGFPASPCSPCDQRQCQSLDAARLRFDPKRRESSRAPRQSRDVDCRLSKGAERNIGRLHFRKQQSRRETLQKQTLRVVEAMTRTEDTWGICLEQSAGVKQD